MKSARHLWACVFSTAILVAAGSGARGDMIYLTASGPEMGSFLGSPLTNYNATVSYDTSETASIPGVYAADLTFDASSPGSSPEAATLTIIANTNDPAGNLASEIAVDASESGGPLAVDDSLDIYAPVGTFISTLPTLAEWQSLISGGGYTADANGSASIYEYSIGYAPVGGYSATSLALTVSPDAPMSVPTPAAWIGGISLLALCGLRKLCGTTM
ncbi:MAG TPA: hypothetical protein VGG19_20170 [Tepidisphaeraceae bacterium]